MTPEPPSNKLHTTVSAVLLAYNHAHTIARAIESILAQSSPFDCVLVSDDCSTDNSVEVIERYAASDGRIRLIQPGRNLGMSANANFAVAHVETDYFAILHHDDLYMPDANGKWKAVLDGHPDIGFVYNAHYDEAGKRSFIDPHPNVRVDGNDFLARYLLPRWSSPVWGAAFVRKSAWDAVGGMKTEYGDIADVYLWMHLASRFAVGYVPEPLFQIFHDRPVDYPEEYRAFSWRRHGSLVRIHGDLRRVLLDQKQLSRSAFLWFRLRATALTVTWLAYAIFKRKWSMLANFKTYEAKYELFWVRFLPRLIEGLGF